MRRCLFTLLSLFVFTLTAFSSAAGAGSGQAPNINFSKMPLHFIPNQGQVDSQVSFYAKAKGYTLWMTKEGLVFDIIQKNGIEGNATRDVSQLIFHGANTNPGISALGKTRHQVSYLKGNDKSKWRGNIPTSQAVMYRKIYNHIDLKVYGIEKEIEYDWIIHPQGNPGDILFEYKNVVNTEITENGNISIRTSAGKLTHRKPYSYQVIDGKTIEVNARFKQVKKNVYTLEVGEYDKNHRLVIDPVILFSTYFGTTNNYEYFSRFTTDRNGRVYLAGSTMSDVFPTNASSFQPTKVPGDSDGFIAVFDTAVGGVNSLIYSTYLGGQYTDSVNDIKVDSSGMIYVTGNTADCSATNYFPQTDPQIPYMPSGGYDVFVSKIDITRDVTEQLRYSVLFGGNGTDIGACIAVNGNNIFVAGYTSSLSEAPAGNPNYREFPITTNAYQTELKVSTEGNSDFFIAHLVENGEVPVYCSYLGAEGSEYYGGTSPNLNRITLGTNNLVYIIGETNFDDFPNPGVSTRNGGWDGFLTVIDTSKSGTSSLLYHTYVGGSGDDYVNGIHVKQENGKDAVYITGETRSPFLNFPVTGNAYQNTRSGISDAFITKLSLNPYSGDTALQYCSYLGGSSIDEGIALTVDDNGIVYVVGRTESYNFPNANAFQTQLASTFDGFVSMLNISRAGEGMIFSSFLGGRGGDYGKIIGLDSNGNILTAGYTTNTNDLNPQFPLVNPYKSTLGGDQFGDAYVTLIDLYGTNPLSYINLVSPNGGEVWFKNKNRDITWNYSGIADTATVRLVLYKSGVEQGTIADNILISDGSYTWNVGDYGSSSATPATDYTIRVESGTYWDQSENNFSITEPVLTVTAPNGGERVYVGQQLAVNWTYSNLTGNVLVQLYKNGIAVEELGTVAVENGTLSWTVPSDYMTGMDYKISVSQQDLVDMSDEDFVIRGPLTKNDYNKDGKSDLLWRNYSNGKNIIWFMDYAGSLTRTGTQYLDIHTDINYIIAGTGDFNNDGNTDILWRNTAGQVGENEVWFMDGTTTIGTASISAVSEQKWQVGGTGDFNGDGQTDILWRNYDNGRNVIWYMNGVTATGTYDYIPDETVTSWVIAAVHDFNGDGKPDVLWRNTAAPGDVKVWIMDNATYVSTLTLPACADLTWKLEGVGDFDNNGSPDLLWRKYSTDQNAGKNVVWYMNGSTLLSSAYLDIVTDLNWDLENH